MDDILKYTAADQTKQIPVAHAKAESLRPERNATSDQTRTADTEVNATELLNDIRITDPIVFKETCKKFYDNISDQLNKTIFGEYAYFLNYGFVPNGTPELSVVPVPKYALNKNSVKMILELIADCSMNGRRILDVGCGRGGTVSVLRQFFSPSSIAGLDLCPKAVEFCKQAHKDATISFYEGDAEALPFADHCFDVVTNVESSHSYPNIRQFYAEVYRVLGPGGHFLYTDVLPRLQFIEEIRHLLRIGFTLELERDITKNVLLSCDEISASRAEAFERDTDSSVLHTFLGLPGSKIYEDLRTEETRYGMWRFKKL